MGALTIRNIDDSVVAAIKRRAGEHGISMEEEVRRLLAETYTGDARVPRTERSSVDDGGEARDEAVRKRDALRNKLNDSIARGGFVSDADLDSALAKKSALLAQEGF